MTKHLEFQIIFTLINTYPPSECLNTEVETDVVEVIGAGVNGGVGTSSSGPEISGNDFTRSFKKSKRLSDKMHCFLHINIKKELIN